MSAAIIGYVRVSTDDQNPGFTHEVSRVEYDARAGSYQSSPT
jgi:DNA invertase Pin-like site-specific DNA recombinase